MLKLPLPVQPGIGGAAQSSVYSQKAVCGHLLEHHKRPEVSRPWPPVKSSGSRDEPLKSAPYKLTSSQEPARPFIFWQYFGVSVCRTEISTVWPPEAMRMTPSLEGAEGGNFCPRNTGMNAEVCRNSRCIVREMRIAERQAGNPQGLARLGIKGHTAVLKLAVADQILTDLRLYGLGNL